MEKKETRGVNCPFCGAPYRKLVPTDALQLKCDYCGATFRTPPRIGVEIPQCYNHPQRFAVGICNDCGQSFCSECLNTFNLQTQNSSVFLYLCPNCIRNRYFKKADAHILSGMVFVLFGVFFGIMFISVQFGFSVFLLLFAGAGVVEIIYGFLRRSEIGEEYPPVISEEGEEKTVVPEMLPQVETEAVGQNAEQVYDELLARYIDKWGVQTGMQLLETEIMAYTRHGDTFAEAVEKVYRRQQKKR